MTRFWVDFSASVLIEAENAEQAEKLFWDNCDPYTDNGIGCGYGSVSIDCIEKEVDYEN